MIENAERERGNERAVRKGKEHNYVDLEVKVRVSM